MAGLAPYAGQRAGRRHHRLARASASPPPRTRWSTALRRAGKRVGVLAVDPSSPFSGGALLGDRVRMQDHALDRDVYIRSMASRGHLGGPRLDDPAGAAGARRGRLRRDPGRDRRRRPERGRDRRARRHDPGADRAGHGRRDPGRQGRHPRDRRRLRHQQGRPRRRRPGRRELCARCWRWPSAPEGAWKPPIVKTVAVKAEGVDDVVAEIGPAPRLARRVGCSSPSAAGRGGPATRSRRSRSPPCASAWGDVHGRSELDDLAAAVAAGDSDPYRGRRRAARHVHGLTAAAPFPEKSTLSARRAPILRRAATGRNDWGRPHERTSHPSLPCLQRRRDDRRRRSAGRTTDDSLAISLVWPLYGVAVLWIGTGTRRSRPWDTLAWRSSPG